MLGCIGIMARGRVEYIEGESECLVEHLGYDASQERAGEFEARIGIDFNEPGIKLAVNHEVQSKDLEVVLVPLRGQFHKGTLYCIQTDPLHPGQNPLLEVIVLLGVVSVEVFLELGIREFISGFMAAIERSIFLDSVVGEVYFPFEVEDVELVGGSADIPFLVPVGLEDFIQLAYHHVVADVKFALAVQEWPVNVQLHDECLIAPILVLPLALHYRVQLVDLVYYSNPITPIRQFPWLHNPNIPHGSADGNSILFVFLLLVDDGLSLLVVYSESFVLRITVAFLDVEGEGDNFEEIACCELVVLLKVIEESLLVAQVEVVGQMVVHLLPLVPHLLQLQNTLPLPDLLTPYPLYRLNELTTLELRHYLIKEIVIFISLLFLWLRSEGLLSLILRLFAGLCAFPFILKEIERSWGLSFEEVVVLKLSPHEVDLQIFLLYDLPPKSTFDEFFDQRTVVSPTDPSLQSFLSANGLLLRLLHVVEEPVAPVKSEQKFTVGSDSPLVDWV